MKYLSRRDDFLSESQLIKLLNETVVWYSKSLRNSLKSIYANTNLQVANNLLDLEGKKLTDDITLLDISADGKYFTYKTLRNVKKMKEEGTLSDETIIDWIENDLKSEDPYTIKIGKSLIGLTFPEDDKIWQEPRQQIKIGRFINNTLKDTPNSEIEILASKIKNMKLGLDLTFKIVEGEEIIKWYNQKNYMTLGATLGDSCMRYERCSTYFDIYTKNPDICKMVCLLEETLEEGKTVQKLVARALIWKVTEKSEGNFEWFMDRRYYSEEQFDDKLKEYASDQGWAYKTINSYTSIKSVTHGGTKFDCEMKIQLRDDIEYKQFPYVDTFKKFYPDTCLLLNDSEERPEEKPYYILKDTNGSFKKVQKSQNKDEVVEGQVYSRLENRWIDEDDAQWSNYENSWISTDNCVYVESMDDCVHIDDAVYSQFYGEYIWGEDAILAITFVYPTGNIDGSGDWVSGSDEQFMSLEELDDTFWYQWITNKFRNWQNSDAIDIALLMDDWEDKLIPKAIRSDTYKLKEHDFYLTKTDAQIVGLETEEDDMRIKDAISYDYDIAKGAEEEWYTKIARSTTEMGRKQRLIEMRNM